MLLCKGDHILLKPLAFIVNSPSHVNANVLFYEINKIELNWIELNWIEL